MQNKIKKSGQTGITGPDINRYGNRYKGPRRNQNFPEYEKARKLEKIERMLISERDAHSEIYGRNFELKDFKEALLRYPLDTLDYWEETGWAPIYFPKIDISQEKFFHDMEMTEKNLSFSEQANSGKILTLNSFDSFHVDNGALLLTGISVLVEKEPYDFSRHIFKKIREEKNAEDKGSADIWQEIIKPAFARSLRVDPSAVRLKRVIEKFTLQFYAKKLARKQGKEDLWEWCLECFDGPFTRLRSNSFRLEKGWYYEDRPDTLFYPLVEL